MVKEKRTCKMGNINIVMSRRTSAIAWGPRFITASDLSNYLDHSPEWELSFSVPKSTPRFMDVTNKVLCVCVYGMDRQPF
jgi:hypothetical protein